MKKIIFLSLLLFCLRPPAFAQGVITYSGWDLALNISFSLLPGSPGTNQPSGQAYYKQAASTSSESNYFEVTIDLGTNQASDGWILEQESDGSLQPVMELTNETSQLTFLPPVYPFQFPGGPLALRYGYLQTAQLTVDQIHNLAEGKWYAEVDYSDDQYLGNLTPANIAPPSPMVIISPSSVFPSPPANLFPGGNATAAVISPGDNRPALVTLNGANSSDVFYLPLGFLWSEGLKPIAGTATTTLSLKPGNYAFTLEVSDSYNTNSTMAMVEVLSPVDALEELMSATAQAGLNRETTRRLLSTLQEAQMPLKRGDNISSNRKLATFQQEVNSYASQMNSLTASFLYGGAQDIIEAVGDQPDNRW